MRNPHDELRGYFEKLVYRYLNINSLRQQLSSIAEWTTHAKTPDNIEALRLGHYFFQLAIYGISRIVLVELSMFLSEAEDRSLLDWLYKAKEHAGSMKPTRYNATLSEQEPIEVAEYRTIIDRQISQLQNQQDTIDRIKSRRDKGIAHLDKKYFDDTNAIESDFPIGDHEIDDLMELVSCILRMHYNCLFEADVTLEVQSVNNVETLLRYARAWMRARRDFSLINIGFSPIVFERDDYEQGKWKVTMKYMNS